MVCAPPKRLLHTARAAEPAHCSRSQISLITWREALSARGFVARAWFILKVRLHQTRMTRINRAISAKLDAWTFWVYSLHSYEKKRSIRAIRAASFARIAPQDCLSRLCIDLTCKSFARFASLASGVNTPVQHEHEGARNRGIGFQTKVKDHFLNQKFFYFFF